MFGEAPPRSFFLFPIGQLTGLRWPRATLVSLEVGPGAREACVGLRSYRDQDR